LSSSYAALPPLKLDVGAADGLRVLPETFVSYVTRIATLLVALGVSSSAAAVPVAVEYFADAKRFKGTAATDLLTFSLYEDEECTQLIGTAGLFAGSGMVQYYVDKTLAATGAAKLPKSVRLRAIIDAPTTDEAPYLRVTGGAVFGIPDD
jgi:hypothetical protein